MTQNIFVLARTVEPQPWSNEDFSPYPDMDDAKAFTSRDKAVAYLQNHAVQLTEHMTTYQRAVIQFEVIERDSTTFRVVGKRDGNTVDTHSSSYSLHELPLDG